MWLDSTGRRRMHRGAADIISTGPSSDARRSEPAVARPRNNRRHVPWSTDNPKPIPSFPLTAKRRPTGGRRWPPHAGVQDAAPVQNRRARPRSPDDLARTARRHAAHLEHHKAVCTSWWRTSVRSISGATISRGSTAKILTSCSFDILLLVTDLARLHAALGSASRWAGPRGIFCASRV